MQGTTANLFPDFQIFQDPSPGWPTKMSCSSGQRNAKPYFWCWKKHSITNPYWSIPIHQNHMYCSQMQASMDGLEYSLNPMKRSMSQIHWPPRNGLLKSYITPVTYVSGLFRGSQLNWAALMKEAYAIYLPVRKLSFYLTNTDVLIRSDHLLLKKFLSKNTMNAKVNNWVSRVGNLQPQIWIHPRHQEHSCLTLSADSLK